MAIPTTQPTTIPEATFDTWVLVEFHSYRAGAVAFGTPGPPLPVTATAILRRSRTREDGVVELSPLDTDQVTIPIADVYAAAAQHPEIATALGALLAAVQAEGARQEKL